MQNDPNRPARYSEADIAAVLADLQNEVSGSSSLLAWQETTGAPVQHVVAGADVTYVHLGAHDSDGAPVVLMLLDGRWRRAM